MDRKPETINNEIERRNATKERVLRQVALMKEATDARISEITQKGEKIRLEIQKTLDDLDQTIQRSISDANSIFRKHRSDLMSIVDRIEVQNGADKAYLVIGRFPVEILGYIFEECVELDTSPWTLAKVCRFWNNTAIGTPSLWNTISVVSSLAEYIRIREIPPGFAHHPRSFRREQVCISLQEVKAAAARSGNGPLNVRLLFGQNSPFHRQSITDLINLNSGVIDEYLLREKPIYEFLFKSPIAQRIKSLEWCSEGMRNFKAIADVFEGSLPMLTTLIMTNAGQGASSEPLANMIVNRTPNLQNVRLSAPVIPTAMGQEFWGRMKEVHVSMSTNVDRLFSGKADIEVLTGLRHEHYGNVWPTATTVRTTFGQLVELEVIIRCISHISRIELPALTKLDILVRVPRDGLQQSTPDFSLQLPVLKSLKVRGLECRSIRHFVMPNLQSLTIISEAVVKNSCEEDLTAICNSGILNSITHFDLAAPLPDKGFVAVFASLRAADTVRLVPGKRLGYPLFKFLAVTRNQMRGIRPIPCPRLRHFTIDLKENTTKVTEGFETNLRRLLKTRKRISVKLEHMKVMRADGVLEDWATMDLDSTLTTNGPSTDDNEPINDDI